MRVLMVSKACVVGAYQRKLEELARLPEMELTVVVPPEWRDPAGVLRLERRYTDGYELVVEPILFNGSYHLHWYPGLGRQMRRVRPEVVHIDEEPYNLATVHALWLARRAGAKSLYFSWQNLERRYPAPFSWMEGYVLRHAEQAIVGNQEAVGVWQAKGYRGPVTVIPQFGVDPEIYRPARPGAGDTGNGGDRVFSIGFAGRLVEEKGADLLLEALARLDGEWRTTVMGSGPARQALDEQARRLGLEDRVSFVAWMPSAEMPDAYRRLDVLVLPSRTKSNWKEQFGRALVEAMACGVAVIGSDSGEIPHVIGEAGLVFPEGQAETLRACLERVMREPGLRAELGRKGRERVLARYTQAEVAARTYEVYREMVGR